MEARKSRAEKLGNSRETMKALISEKDIMGIDWEDLERNKGDDNK